MFTGQASGQCWGHSVFASLPFPSLWFYGWTASCLAWHMLAAKMILSSIRSHLRSNAGHSRWHIIGSLLHQTSSHAWGYQPWFPTCWPHPAAPKGLCALLPLPGWTDEHEVILCGCCLLSWRWYHRFLSIFFLFSNNINLNGNYTTFTKLDTATFLDTKMFQAAYPKGEHIYVLDSNENMPKYKAIIPQVSRTTLS